VKTLGAQLNKMNYILSKINTGRMLDKEKSAKQKNEVKYDYMYYNHLAVYSVLPPNDLLTIQKTIVSKNEYTTSDSHLSIVDLTRIS
jgi:hypothetical protein